MQGRRWLAVAVLVLLTSKLTESGQVVKILALFSGINNDLGIDHRLGRQVLKLAAERARQLHPGEIDRVDLSILNDETDCSNLNSLPHHVAQRFYLGNSGSCGRDSCERSEAAQLELYLNWSSSTSKMVRRNDLRRNTISKEKTQVGNPVDAIIGPSCNFLVDLVARMAAYWQTPIYSVASIGDSFARKEIYSTLTRLSPSIDHLTMFIVRTLETFKWRHVAILADESQAETPVLLNSLERMFLRLHFSIAIEHKVFKLEPQMAIELVRPSSAFNETLDSNSASRDLCKSPLAIEMLESFSKVARVLLILANNNQLIRKLLLCGHQLGMHNGEYTFLAVNLGSKASKVSLSDASSDSRGPAKQTSNRVTQSIDWFAQDDEQNNLYARQMFESLMIFSVELPVSDEYSLFVEQSLDLAHQEFPSVRFERADVGALAVALHDSLLLAVEAQLRYKADNKSSMVEMRDREQLDELEEPTGDTRKAALMWNEHYSSGLFASMHINENGDQELDYVLSDLEPDLGVMRPVVSYSKEARKLQYMPGVYIHWPRKQTARGQPSQESEKPPPDEPECGFTGEAERCLDRQNLYAALTLTSLLVGLILVSSLFGLYKYRKIKYQMQLDDFWWKISWSDLQFIQNIGSLCSTAISGARQLRAGSVVGSLVSDGASSHARLAPAAKRMSGSNASDLKDSDKRKPVLIVTSSDEPAAAKGARRPSAVPSVSSHISSLVKKSAVIIRSQYSSVVRSSNLAMLRDELVIVKQLNGKSIDVSRELLVELRSMREHMADNLAKFMGLCLDPGHLSIVYEYCSRGSLQDMLLNEGVAMDWTLKYSILGDIVSGLSFIHTTLLDYHGRLKSTNLVLDSRFTVKITDFGLQSLYSQLDPIEDDDDDGDAEDDDDDGQVSHADSRLTRRSQRRQADQMSLSVSQAAYNMDSVSQRGAGTKKSYNSISVSNKSKHLKNGKASRHFWTAPEHLRQRNVHCAGSKRGDIYSLAIIFCEIFTRKPPYYYGTNAKPHWPNIKHDRNLQQYDRTSQSGPKGSTAGTSQLHGSLVGSIGRQAKRAQRQMRKSSAMVAPAEIILSAETVEETGSVSSHQSSGQPNLQKRGSQASSSAAQSQAAAARRPSVRLQDAIIEEGSVTAEQQVSGTKADELIDAEEILDQLRMGVEPEPVRPFLPNYVLQDVNGPLIELMRECWLEGPSQRPTVVNVRNKLRRITKGMASKNYLDNLLDRLQNYASELERIVDGKSSDIVHEKQRTEELLYQLVPRFVADRLKSDEPIVPQLFDGVTVFFSDIVGFEKYANILSPYDLVNLLNSIYSSFDSIISSFDVTKIETIIDQFLVASGISLDSDGPPGKEQSTEANNTEMEESEPRKKVVTKKAARKILGSLRRTQSTAVDSSGSQPKSMGKKAESVDVNDGAGEFDTIEEEQPVKTESSEHYKRNSAEQVARMALCIRDLVKSGHFRQGLSGTIGQEDQGTNVGSIVATQFNIRIGIHSGKVCAGIVGVKRPKFCLIGDTVNVASRMQSNSKANKIQISADTKKLLEKVPGLNIEPRGSIEVKGKGKMDTYWLESSY